MMAHKAGNSKNKKQDHFKLGDLLDFIPERMSSKGTSVKTKMSELYKYIEIQNMGYGEYNFNELRGWELPSRARHLAEDGDLYFGSIWGSVSKWCYIGKSVNNIVVTNGCHRCRIKTGKEDYLLDLLAYINPEVWATQMRSLARGSDGLAEVIAEDAKNIIIPKITERKLRKELEPFIQNLKESRVTLNTTISLLIHEKVWDLVEPNKRPSHIVLV